MQRATVTDATNGISGSDVRETATDPLLLRARLVLGSNHRYEPLRVLGEGGMGVVFEVRDAELARPIALKLVRPCDGDVDAAHARLRREAQAMAQLAHPNVVTVFDVGAIEDQVFIAMELVAGGTLRDHVGSNHAWRQQLRVLLAAGRGLCAAHAAGILHRDFKPDNVLVGGDGRARVTDFGLAFADDPARSLIATPSSITQTGAFAGTVAYLAPERLHGVTDARTDQFAFAVTVFEILDGQRPFDSSDLEAHISSVRAGRRPWTRGAVPRRIRQIVDRGLAADPAVRWPSLTAMLDAIERAMRSRVAWFAAGLVLAGVVTFMVTARLQARRQEFQLPPWEPRLVARDTDGDRITVGIVGKRGTVFAFVSEGVLWFRDAGSSTRRAVTLPPQLEPHRLAMSSDASTIFVCGSVADGWEVWRIGFDQPTTTARLRRGEDPCSLAVSPDDTQLAIVANRGGLGGKPDIELLDLQTATARTLVPRVEGLGWQVSWSPDGKRLIGVRSRLDGSRSADEGAFIIDATTGALSRVDVPVVAGLELHWLSHETVLLKYLVAGNRPGHRTILEVAEVSRIMERKRIYQTLDYTEVVELQVDRGRVMMSTLTAARRVGLIALGSPDHALKVLSGGSLSDEWNAGWNRNNELVIGANLAGNFDVVAIKPDGTRRSLFDGPDEQRVAVVADDDLYFDGTGKAQFVVRGVRPPQRRAYDDGTMFCAGGHSYPCMVLGSASPPRSDVRTIFRWNPDQMVRGERVIDVAWTSSHQEPALSPDGKRVAVPRSSAGIDVYDLERDSKRTISVAAGHSSQFVAWGGDGDLYATGSDKVRQSITRIARDGTMTTLASSGMQWFSSPFVSRDGSHLAVIVSDLTTTYWLVDTTR